MINTFISDAVRSLKRHAHYISLLMDLNILLLSKAQNYVLFDQHRVGGTDK